MDVSELIAMKYKLQSDLNVRITEFIKETNVRPDITVNTGTAEYVDQPPSHYVDVRVSLKI